MLGLPEKSEFDLKIAKEKFYTHGSVTKKEKDMFVSDVERIVWKHKLSEQTTNIAASEAVGEIEVIYLELRNKDFDIRLLKLINKTIPYKIVFALEYKGEICLALYHGEKLFRTQWQSPDGIKLLMNGLNLEQVWESFVVQIGRIEITDDNTLDEQIIIDEQRAKLQKEINKLEKMARAEKQPKKKFEIVQQIKKLEERLNDNSRITAN